MWTFVSPQLVFGEGALDAIDELDGSTALIVSDGTLVELGIVQRVLDKLRVAGFDTTLFADVEPEPSVATVERIIAQAGEVQPDWIIGLGGGSCMDAAKAAWVLYLCPELEAAAINPIVPLNVRLRCGIAPRCRLAMIPTTSGTGSEATWAIVLTDRAASRKMGLGNRENVADLAIVDPSLAQGMPPRLTVDTGLDALTHAIEGYTCTWHTDITDGLCLQAVRLVLRWLPDALANGNDTEARERMANAATCAGLGFGNALASLAHAMGHALGAAFHIPHGRAVSLCLPYTVEFAANEAPERYADLASVLGCAAIAGCGGAMALATLVREFTERVGGSLSLSSLGVTRDEFAASLDKLVDDAFNDTQILSAPRVPSYEELGRLYACIYSGVRVDF